MIFSIDNLEGVATAPFGKYVWKKMPRRTRVNSVIGLRKATVLLTRLVHFKFAVNNASISCTAVIGCTCTVTTIDAAEWPAQWAT